MRIRRESTSGLTIRQLPLTIRSGLGVLDNPRTFLFTSSDASKKNVMSTQWARFSKFVFRSFSMVGLSWRLRNIWRLTEGSKMKPEEVVVFNFFFALGDWCVAYSRYFCRPLQWVSHYFKPVISHQWNWEQLYRCRLWLRRLCSVKAKSLESSAIGCPENSHCDWLVLLLLLATPMI